MKSYQINNFLLIYILSIAFFVIFYLFVKHDVGNDSSISEWLINYNGGFTRRGLGGEIVIGLANIFEISLRKSIFLIQTFFHLIYLALIYVYLKNIKFNIIQIFALFAPIFLLYPVAEIEVLGRKEIILFLYFITLLFFAEKKFSKNFINIQTIFFLPIVCLIYEEVVLYFPFIASVVIIKNNFKKFSETFFKILIIFFPAIISILIVLILPLDRAGHKEMCDFLLNEFGERCYMSANLLVANTIYFSTWDVVHENAKFIHYFRYFCIFLIGFLPLNILIFNNHFLGKNNYISNHFKPNLLFFLLYSPALLLFAFGYDWGRWINITYTYSILFYFYLIKNKLISNYNENHNKLLIKLFKKKMLTILVFVIFAFGWNPKTVLTGDIASFPGYRVPYKALKIFNSKFK